MRLDQSVSHEDVCGEKLESINIEFHLTPKNQQMEGTYGSF